MFPRSSWRGTSILSNNLKGLCLILDRDVLRTGPSDAMKAALSAGVRFFQYRDKSGSRRQIYETCSQLATMARESGALFIVNDHVDIAVAVNADGAHLGQDDLPIESARKMLAPGKLVGISTHSREEATAAEYAGADYIGFGPIFATATKDAGRVQGTAGIVLIKQTVKVPVIAIGGINHANVREVIQSGADGVAIISAILSAPDLKQAAEQMVALIQN